jgi:ubiquinone/menaquinone biosynthesis C-methylase UbiE
MSLSRVLEPEVMDSDAEAEAYDTMDHAVVNARFCEDLLALAPDLTRTLDVGTGTALIPIELCRRAPEARVLAIDLADSMLKLGEANVARAGFSSAIRLQRADAKALEHPAGAFTCVVSNTIVHHIPEPEAPLREMWRVLASGGRLFVRDLIRPDDDRSVRALVETYAADQTAQQRQLFDASLRAAFTLSEIVTLAARVGLPEGAVRATSDRHWTLACRKN